jgi:hypothetical protein
MASIEEIAFRISFRVCMSVSQLQGSDTDSVVTTEMKPLGFFHIASRNLTPHHDSSRINYRSSDRRLRSSYAYRKQTGRVSED